MTAKTKDEYAKAGVDIDVANSTKGEMAKILQGGDKRVLNKFGAFANLFDASFPGYKNPVLVLKTEEPGTKQKLAIDNDSVETVCHDLVNHLVNDAIVTGARPLSVQDCIVCGRMEKETILRIVGALNKACKENECILTGGETSEQPGVVEAGTYILTASIVGVVEKELIIDGSKIREGDMVLALASSGIHTNGLSLVRKIMKDSPEILNEKIEGETFIKTILTPHRSYYTCLKDLFGKDGLVGLAHITGGGIKENLNRILPENLDALIEVDKIKVPEIFKVLKKFGNLEDEDMYRAFNVGVGMAAVVKKEFTQEVQKHIKKYNIDAYEIGSIINGSGKVILK